jgi:multidrug efflux pump subunit AcrB
MGFTLNTFTLLGLSLAIGIVVDDAIMVLENIVRHREKGLTKVQAAITGAREIAPAAVAATIAILAIFIPVIFMEGIIGKFLFQYGVTLTVAVAISLIEALTIAPMRCSQFLEVGHSTWMGRKMDSLMDWTRLRYARILESCLNWRWSVLLAAFAIFGASLFILPQLKKEFVPSQDQSRFLVRIQTPVGSSMEITDAVFRKAEAIVMDHPALHRYFAAVGGFGGGEVNTGNMFVTMKDRKDRPRNPETGKRITQAEFMAFIRKEFNAIPGVRRAVVQDLSQQGFSAQRGFPVEFSLLGSEWSKLEEYTELLMEEMKKTGLMTDIDTDYQLGQPEVRIFPDRQKAAARGVSVADIGTAINATVGGLRAGQFTRGGKRYDIRIRYTEDFRQNPEDIKKVWVRNNRGEVIRLSDVVRIETKPTLLSITRKDRARAIRIYANVAAGSSQAAAMAKVQNIAKEKLPEGYRIVLSGSAQTFKESFESLIFALILGIFVAYMVLASQYNSFIHPFTVLLALPFSLTGAFLALWISGYSINIFSMIGIVLLMGIVKKNSILLVDFTNERRKHGLPVREALLEACPIRLRPIIMTSIATITAAIPPALGLGPGEETRIPMALVIIGGVALSTLLTLFVVPCAYSLLSRMESHKHEKELKEALIELGELPAEANRP